MANGSTYSRLRTRLLEAAAGPEAIPALVNRVRVALSMGVLLPGSPRPLETVIHHA